MPREGDILHYDTIVVGAGSSGAVIAARLTEDPEHSVLLLEAGPDYPDFESLPEELKFGFSTATDVVVTEHNWQFVGKATDLAEPILVPRGKVTGGSSAVNGQMYLRGLPEDFDTWASLGNDEWTFDKSLPYFRKLENDLDCRDDIHGADGPISVRRFKPEEWVPAQRVFYNACRAHGFPDCPDFNKPGSWGVGPTPVNNLDGIRLSTAVGYLDPARHRPNLTIKPNCLVRRILFKGKRAAAVEVESLGGTVTFEGGQIILGAGAIGSPQLLMLSGVGPGDHLRSLNIPVVHGLPGVGHNLRDHPAVYATWRTKPGFELDGLAPRIQLCLRYTAQGSHLRDDMMVLMHSFAPERHSRGGLRMEAVGIRMIVCLYLAVGSGKLSLTSKNPDTQPFLDYNYLRDPFDRQRMREGVRLCLDLAEHGEFKAILDDRIEPLDSDLADDQALDRWLMREVNTAHHISGTCKMGPSSDPMSVVDQFARVYGMEGLRVADASIMPDCTRANTNATAMMIGERVADFIRSAE